MVNTHVDKMKTHLKALRSRNSFNGWMLIYPNKKKNHKPVHNIEINGVDSVSTNFKIITFNFFHQNELNRTYIVCQIVYDFSLSWLWNEMCETESTNSWNKTMKSNWRRCCTFVTHILCFQPGRKEKKTLHS